MTTDRLAIMLKMQADLQAEAYGHRLAEFTPEMRVNFIKNMVLAATDELHEALNETSWKPWSTSFGEVAEEAYFGELIDLWHFVMNLFLVAYPGLPPEALAAAIELRYAQKRKVNIKRQEDGYDGKTGKCIGCKRALDDPTTGCGEVDPEDDTMWCDVNGDWFSADGGAFV